MLGDGLQDQFRSILKHELFLVCPITIRMIIRNISCDVPLCGEICPLSVPLLRISTKIVLEKRWNIVMILAYYTLRLVGDIGEVHPQNKFRRFFDCNQE
jgi:hypothetical protein